MSVSRLVAAAAALVVAVIFGSQLTTGALWTTSASLGAGSITSGTLDLVNGSTTSQSASYRFTALDGTNLGPGAAVQAPLVVTNAGDIDYAARLSGVTQTNTRLAGWIDVRVVQVTGSTACPASGAPTGTAVFTGDLEQATGTWSSTLPAGTAATYCIRVRLKSTAPPTAAAQNASIAFTFTGRQARNA